MAQYAKDTPLVIAAKFNVPPTALDDGTGAYGTLVHAGTGGWVLGSTLLGRKLMGVVTNGALTGAPTGLKLGLYSGSDANGTGAALVTGTDTEWATPAANTARQVEIPLTGVVATSYYSLGLSLNGAGTTAVTAAAIAMFLDPLFKS